MAVDGSLKFDTKVNTSGFQKGANSINQSCNSMMSSFKSLGAAIGIAFGIAAIVNFSKASIKASNDIENAMMGLKSIIEGQGRSFSTANSFIQDYISDGLIPATDAVTAYKNLAMRGYSDDQIQKTMLALKDSSAFGRSAALSMGEAVKSATEGIRNENSILVDNAGVTKNVSMMWKDYAKSIGVGVDSLTKQQKIQAEVLGIMEETRFQTGDAARVADSYSGSILRLQFNLNNMKIAFGNFLKPIISAVIPVINKAIEVLTRFFNMLAQISALLFGKKTTSAEQAKKQEEAIGGAVENEKDLTNAVDKTNKKLGKTQSGFDELFILSKDTAENAEGMSPDIPDLGSGGNGGGGEELGGGVTISPEIEKFVANIKKAFEAIGAWFDKYLAPIFADIWENMQPNIANFKAILQDMFSDVATLGEPLKAWFTNNFTPFLQSYVKYCGTVINGLFDSFNMVLSDVWNIVIMPWAETFVTVILPLVTDFATEYVKTMEALFVEVKQVFDTLWSEAVAPGLELMMGIWQDCWGSIKACWDRWGKPIFENIRKAIENMGDIFQAGWDNFLKPMWDNFMNAVDWLWEKHLKPLLDNFLDFVGELINGALEIYNKFVAPLVIWFEETFGEFFSNIFNTALNIVTTVIAGIIDVIDGIVTFLKGVIQFIVGVFTGDWDKAWQGIKNIFKGVWDALVGIVKVPINLIIDLVNGMVGAVVAGVNIIIRALNSISFDVPDWVPLFGGETIGINIPELKIPKIPKLARGAVIPPNREFMAVLGDQKSGTNIETPLATMIEAMEAALNKRGTAPTGGQTRMQVILDGKSIGEFVIDYINGITEATNVTPILI